MAEHRDGAGQKPAEDGWAKEQLTSPCSLVIFLGNLLPSGFSIVLVMSSFFPNFLLLESWDNV